MSVLCIVNSSESNVPAYWTDHSRTPMWFARWIIIWIHCHHQSPLFGQIKETPCKPAMHGHTQWTGRVVHAFCHNSPINGSTRKGFWRLKFRATKSSRGVMDGDGVLVYKFYKLRSLLRSSEVAPQWDPRVLHRARHAPIQRIIVLSRKPSMCICTLLKIPMTS